MQHHNTSTVGRPLRTGTKGDTLGEERHKINTHAQGKTEVKDQLMGKHRAVLTRAAFPVWYKLVNC